MNERDGTRTHTVWFSVCVHFIVLPLSLRAKDCDGCWRERWRQSETPGVLSAVSSTLCFAGEVRADLALTVSLWCTFSQTLPGWSVQSSLEADEAKPPFPADSSPWPRPAPSWPWGTPQGCRRSAALPLCCGLAEVHASLPRRSGPPVYPANSQALHAEIQRPGGSRLGAPGGPGLSELPWACACTRAQRPSAQELMAHTLCRCGHEPGRWSGQEEGRGRRKEGRYCWALPNSASQEPCDLEPLGPEASVSHHTCSSRAGESSKLTNSQDSGDLSAGDMAMERDHQFFFFFNFLAMPRGKWDLSFPTRGRTHVPCIGSTEA